VLRSLVYASGECVNNFSTVGSDPLIAHEINSVCTTSIKNERENILCSRINNIECLTHSKGIII
jgi:hypothetical protein